MTARADTTSLAWSRYPHVADNPHARQWLTNMDSLGRDPKTLDAYARSLDEWLAYLDRSEVSFSEAGEDTGATYVRWMRQQPGALGRGVRRIDNAAGRSTATMKQRLTAVRLFYTYLIRKRIARDQPAPAGQYRRSAKGGKGQPASGGMIPHRERLPWVPQDWEWKDFLDAARQESLRTRVMILLAYDGALRRESVIGLDVRDIDAARRAIRLRPEIVKGGREYTTWYGPVTEELLVRHMREQGARAPFLPAVSRTRLFLSESNRNRDRPLTVSSWNKLITKIAERAGTIEFHPHTLRHLRLTHMAQAGLELYEIQQWAGHESSHTTTKYLRMVGRDLQKKVARHTEHLHAHLERMARDLDLTAEAGA